MAPNSRFRFLTRDRSRAWPYIVRYGLRTLLSNNPVNSRQYKRHFLMGPTGLDAAHALAGVRPLAYTYQMSKLAAALSPNRQRRYSREEIVEAAKELLREEGRVAFSTRKLAARVGLSVMGIYTYFHSKDDILDAVAESYFSAFESPPIQKNWRTFIVRWSNAVYEFFSAHPEALELVAWKDHVASRAWRRLWLPLAKMWSAFGLKRQKLIYVTNWVSSVVLGEIQNQSHRPTPEASAQLYAELAADFPEDAPILKELAQAVSGLEDKRMFDYAIRMLLVGLEASLAETPKPSRRV